jgi:hypothetical protein
LKLRKKAVFCAVQYLDFENRWLKSGGAERANYAPFLQELCDLLGVPRPDGTTDNPAQDAYVFERAVTFNEGGGKQTTGRIDLYKRGCFVLETKQGTNSPDEQAAAELAQLGLPPAKRRKGHAVRGTAKWEQMMKAAYEQALRYVRALPASEPRLDNYQNIKQQDAVLGHNADYSKTWPAEWPAADFIVGNPLLSGPLECATR